MVRIRSAGRRYETDPDKQAKRLDREGLAVFGRILQYVRPYLNWMIVAGVALLLSASVSLLLPLVIRNLVDVVFASAPAEVSRFEETVFRLLGAGGEGTAMQRLNRLIGGLFIVFVLQAIFSFIHRLSIAYVGERAVADLRADLYRRLQRLSLTFYADHRTGEIVSRVTNDTSSVQNAMTDNLIALVRQAFTLIGAAALLFYLNWRLTLIIVVGIPLMSLTIVTLGRRIRDASKDVQDRLADAANVVEETTSGVRIVKSFAREAFEFGRYRSTVDDIYEAALYRAKISAFLAPIIGLLAFGSITATMWFGSRQVLSGELTAGGLVAYLIYTMMVATPVSSLAGLYAQFQAAIGASERIFNLMDTPPDIVERPGAMSLPAIDGYVRFTDVDFQYNERVAVLDGISFSAEPGQVIALVGPSGAGKSTLVNLIPRFYDVVTGSISIDNHDIRNVTIESLRQQIGIVPQETILFSDTVENNIRYGRLDATSAEIEAAARAANAHAFIQNELPDGYQTLVGERGIKLSGGQRQRIAIARAILKDPRILILDEATSSLDSESERLVQDALERLMKGRTTIVIAHRLSTITNADNILVLEQGGLIESGTHAELLRNSDGLYTRLHDMQFSVSRHAIE